MYYIKSYKLHALISFITDLQCLQAVVESQTKTLHPKCHDMLVQRMEMFKNAKAVVRKNCYNNIFICKHKLNFLSHLFLQLSSTFNYNTASQIIYIFSYFRF